MNQSLLREHGNKLLTSSSPIHHIDGLPNESSDTQIFQLPFDILSDIFKTICVSTSYSPTSDNHPSRVKLMLVCRHWLAVVVETPYLWNEIKFIRSCWTDEGQVDILHNLIRNAGEAPLDIGLLNCPIDLMNENSLLPKVPDTLFSQYARNIRSITIKTYVPKSWLEQLSKLWSLGAFPKLESFALEPPAQLQSRAIIPPAYPVPIGDPSIRLSFPNTPSLKHLSITNVNIRFVLPWEQITSLHLHSTNPELALKIIVQCPNLEALDVSTRAWISEFPYVDFSALPVSIPLNRLHSLRFKNNAYTIPLSWSETLLHHFAFSSLNNLKLDALIDENPDFLLKFFQIHSRTMESLTALSLRCSNAGNQLGIIDLKNILHPLKSLRSLELDLTNDWDDTVLPNASKALRVTDDHRILPQLTHLAFKSRINILVDSTSSAGILEVLSSRRGLSQRSRSPALMQCELVDVGRVRELEKFTLDLDVEKDMLKNSSGGSSLRRS
ncbi:hypothetical protein NP233_g249 [Leucocoprinus birnbaumii]|uniref:F-box domain-containing protein n=1 Tax=Leucocoprinus birnbaumii TaxID=56174 RepID=A0AAD5W2H6_9AGAR|nr:hypothetical protein NP233_g249 [Leucocoprinus birnbaumii]